MPIFRFVLTDTDSGERRIVSVSANSKEEAEEVILRQEQKKVGLFLSDAEVKDLEQKLKDGTLSGRDKARLFAHQQEKPYVIQKAKEAEA